MLRQKGWKWIVKARTIGAECVDLQVRLKRAQRRLNTAMRHAAEQMVGLLPGDRVTVHQSYFEANGQNAPAERTEPLTVLRVYFGALRGFTQHNPEILVILSPLNMPPGLFDKPTFPVCARLHDLSKYLTKEP